MALVFLSFVLISMGSAIILIEKNSDTKAQASVVVVVGIIGLIISIKNMVNSVVTIFLPQREDDLVDIVYQKRYLERGSNVVTIGGGTGLSVLLHGLKSYSNNIKFMVGLFFTIHL